MGHILVLRTLTNPLLIKFKKGRRLYSITRYLTPNSIIDFQWRRKTRVEFTRKTFSMQQMMYSLTREWSNKQEHGSYSMMYFEIQDLCSDKNVKKPLVGLMLHTVNWKLFGATSLGSKAASFLKIRLTHIQAQTVIPVYRRCRCI